MTKVTTGTVEAPGAVLTYDVHEPETSSEHRPLFVFGSPMAASGFEQLISHVTDRTVITYDPRGAERSTLTPDGTVTGELSLRARPRRVACLVGPDRARDRGRVGRHAGPQRR